MNSPLSIGSRVYQLDESQRQWLAGAIEKRMQKSSATTETHERSELAAWAVVDQDQVDVAALQTCLRERLPESLVPKHITLVPQIPKTASGKIDRNQLVNLPIRRSNERNRISSHSARWTPSESILVRLSERLLRCTGVRPEDHFFEMGGDSFASIQLIALAREQGLKLEPRDVIESDSLGTLAAIADSRQNLDRSEADRKKQLEDQIPVVAEVRSGKGGASALMVHEVGGRCGYARYLAADLLPGVSLYVTNQPAVDHSPTSLEALAELYADAWMAAEPDGPKTLVAFCWGGPLAYAIASHLANEYHIRTHLIIIESGTEASYEHAPGHRRFVDQQKGNFIRLRSRLKSISDWQSLRSLCSSVLGKLMGKRNAPITADSGFQFRDDEGDPAQIRSNVQAFLDFRPRPQDVSLDLFRVRGPAGLIGARYSDRSLGWRYVIGGRLRLQTISGNHNDCVAPPHAEGLVAAINASYETAGHSPSS
ncbi:MAG: thioesterase domain-containing protein [Planctomycetota bacterium]